MMTDHMKIYGSIICQNNVEDIIRSIDSIAYITDDIYVVDGYSIDGTWEALQAYKNAYGLKLTQHKFKDMVDQRNFALSLIPKDSWIVSVDSDEKFNHKLSVELRDFLLTNFEPSVYTGERTRPICIGIPVYMLLRDVMHYDDSAANMLTSKVYYYDRNLHFTSGYHSQQVYNDNDPDILMYPGRPGWAIFHYAFLNEKRLKKIHEDIKAGRVSYALDQWDTKNKPIKDLIEPLW